MDTSAINCTMEEDANLEDSGARHPCEPLHRVSGMTIGDHRETVTVTGSGGTESLHVEDEVAASDPTADQQQLPVSIPDEPLKTLLAFAGMLTGMLLTAISLSIVHDRLPESPPLPDISLQFIPNLKNAIIVSEILLMSNMAIAVVTCLLNRYRCVVLRRVFFIIGIVFAYRAACIIVTAIPDSNWRNKCAPKINGSVTFEIVVRRTVLVAIGGGFAVSKSHSLCGDSIFSGHTASLTISYLMISHYAPLAAKPLRWISFFVCLSSFTFLLLSHAHYTVDLMIAYWLVSRLWWIFHTLVDFPAQKRHESYLRQVWWFPIFNYLEANVPSKLPCEFYVPWPHLERAYRRFGALRQINNVRRRLRRFINN